MKKIIVLIILVALLIFYWLMSEEKIKEKNLDLTRDYSILVGFISASIIFTSFI